MFWEHDFKHRSHHDRLDSFSKRCCCEKKEKPKCKCRCICCCKFEKHHDFDFKKHHDCEFKFEKHHDCGCDRRKRFW